MRARSAAEHGCALQLTPTHPADTVFIADAEAAPGHKRVKLLGHNAAAPTKTALSWAGNVHGLPYPSSYIPERVRTHMAERPARDFPAMGPVSAGGFFLDQSEVWARDTAAVGQLALQLLCGEQVQLKAQDSPFAFVTALVHACPQVHKHLSTDEGRRELGVLVHMAHHMLRTRVVRTSGGADDSHIRVGDQQHPLLTVASVPPAMAAKMASMRQATTDSHVASLEAATAPGLFDGGPIRAGGLAVDDSHTKVSFGSAGAKLAVLGCVAVLYGDASVEQLDASSSADDTPPLPTSIQDGAPAVVPLHSAYTVHCDKGDLAGVLERLPAALEELCGPSPSISAPSQTVLDKLWRMLETTHQAAHAP